MSELTVPELAAYALADTCSQLNIFYNGLICIRTGLQGDGWKGVAVWWKTCASPSSAMWMAVWALCNVRPRNYEPCHSYGHFFGTSPHSFPPLRVHVPLFKRYLPLQRHTQQGNSLDKQQNGSGMVKRLSIETLNIMFSNFNACGSKKNACGSKK